MCVCSHQFPYTLFAEDTIKVLLYNFFESSPASYQQWRLVLNTLQPQDTFCTWVVGNVPRFDDIKHATICQEVRREFVALSGMVC